MDASFLSSQTLVIGSGLMDRLHATYARPLTVFKTAQEVQIFSDPNFNFAYIPNQNNTNFQEIPVSGVIMARVKYADQEQLKRLFATENRAQGGADEIRVDLEKALVRIKFDKEALPFFQDAKKIILDGQSFVNHSSIRPHGAFNFPQHYTIYLEQTQ